MIKKLIITTGACTVAFNGYVWNSRRNIRGMNTFKPGSADEMLMETLHPGDILMFQRGWDKYYVPKALSVATYQYLHGCGLDHCGMIVQNNMGDLFIFELSPDGYTCTPYRERIFKSHSAAIVLVPVLSSEYERNSVQYRERIFQEVNRLMAGASQPYEPLEVIKGCVSKCSGYLDHPHSPSLRAIIDVLQSSTGAKFKLKNGNPLSEATPEDLFTQRMCIVDPVAITRAEATDAASDARWMKFGATIIIRDM